jgi:RNase P subunit RPR2
MPPDQEFLLYPLDTGEDPLCDRCRLPMLLAAHEVRTGKPDFVTFRCERCGRSEKFVCEEDAAD